MQRMRLKVSGENRLRILSCLLATAAGLSGSVCAQQPIRSVAAIRHLTPWRAGEGLPVQVEGQVLCVNPFNGSFFLRSDGVGIHVSWPHDSEPAVVSRAGDLVRVVGLTHKGSFNPGITAGSVETLGTEELPPPRQFHTSEILSAKNDCDWVWLIGRIRSVEVSSRGNQGPFATLDIDVDGVSSQVDIPLMDRERDEEVLRSLMFNRIRFNAVSGVQYNYNRQLVGRTFYVNSVHDFEELSEGSRASELAAKSLAIHELARTGSFREMVKTSGLVTHVAGRTVYLRGEQACLKVSLREPAEVVDGDWVEVVGFAVIGNVGPSFLARKISVLEHRTVPAAVPLDLKNRLISHVRYYRTDSSLNYELVQVKAQLVEVSESFLATGEERNLQLLCRQSGQVFTVNLPYQVGEMDRLKPGSTLRITGVCHLVRDENRHDRMYVDWFWIQSRGAQDIEILAQAPWWTTARLVGLLGGVLGILVLFAAWIAALRRTVGRQTAVIAEKIERESVHNERQRIARELHDNLSQGLSGTIFQLGACRQLQEMGCERLAKLIQSGEGGNDPVVMNEVLGQLSTELSSNVKKHQEAFAVAEGMLRHCADESRLSILDLRGGLLEKMDLVSAVKATLAQLEKEREVPCELSVDGDPVWLKQIAERNILLVIKEAVSNAIRHGAPNRVNVSLNYTAGLTVSVSDDGSGFDVKNEGSYGHFGLKGMRERMNQIGGMLEIKSAVGSGTTVAARLTSINEWERE